MAALIRLSPTGLNLFVDCPRCFWLHHNGGLHRPRGPFPSLPGGMDSVLRKYYQKFAGSLPPELEGKVQGKIVADRGIIGKKLAYPDTKRDAILWGKLDECLVQGKRYTPLDFKTRASAPKEGASEEFYGLQLDTYALLLTENGYPVADFAYLVYYFPDEVVDQGLVRFQAEVVKVGVDSDRSQTIFAKAVACLRGKRPKKHSSCAYCCWNEGLQDL